MIDVLIALAVTARCPSRGRRVVALLTDPTGPHHARDASIRDLLAYPEEFKRKSDETAREEGGGGPRFRWTLFNQYSTQSCSIVPVRNASRRSRECPPRRSAPQAKDSPRVPHHACPGPETPSHSHPDFVSRPRKRGRASASDPVTRPSRTTSECRSPCRSRSRAHGSSSASSGSARACHARLASSSTRASLLNIRSRFSPGAVTRACRNALMSPQKSPSPCMTSLRCRK